MIEKNASEIVGKINEQIYEIYESDTSEFQLNYISNGQDQLVKWLDIVLWKSCDDDRKFDENLREFESLEKYLKIKIVAILNSLLFRFQTIKTNFLM